jgi:hypothetical protein
VAKATLNAKSKRLNIPGWSLSDSSGNSCSIEQEGNTGVPASSLAPASSPNEGDSARFSTFPWTMISFQAQALTSGRASATV